MWLASGFYRVLPDQQGIVLRFGEYNRTTQPGLNYHLPAPIESVSAYVGRPAGGGGSGAGAGQAGTAVASAAAAACTNANTPG